MKGCVEKICQRRDSYTTDSSSSTGKQKTSKLGCTCCLFTGITLCTLGVLLLIWSPQEIILRERLRMLPGLPAFEWWKVPPDKVRFGIYIFNVTNSEEFMAGIDEKLHVQEIGPIVYKEIFEHLNVTFHKNGTLGYISKRTAVFLPEDTKVDMNATMIVPNYAVLGMASFLYDASFITKFGFNMILRTIGSPVFIMSTPYDLLWNLTDPLLNAGKKVYPNLVPFLNIGMLATIYEKYEDSSTVFIGVDNGNERFFGIDTFRGSPYLTGDKDVCPDMITNSTEGVLYPQNITKTTTVKYWRKTLCHVADLHYERTLVNYADYRVNAYKFTMDNNSYDRKPKTEFDCYAGKPTLPDGLSDASICYHNIPMSASFPHFLYASEDLKQKVTGLQPNRTKHESFVILEPLTGIPIEGFARSQCNLVVRDTSGFTSDLQKFSNQIIPMFWLEYNQHGIPNYVSNLMYFMVESVPKYQYYFVSLILIIGAVILVFNINQYIVCHRYYKNENIKLNEQFQLESEKFIKVLQ